MVLNALQLSDIEAKDSSNSGIEQIETRLEQCLERRQMLYESFMQQQLSNEEFRVAMAECSEETERLNQQRAVRRKTLQNSTDQKELLQMAELATASTANPRDVVAKLIKKVLVFPDNRIEIIWQIADFAQ